jgi:hypothetical protein
MTRDEYEQIASAFEQTYQDYGKMMRRTIPEAWRVEAAEKDLAELRQLMKQYEDEHPEEFRGQTGNHDAEQTDQTNQPDEEGVGVDGWTRRWFKPATRSGRVRCSVGPGDSHHSRT